MRLITTEGTEDTEELLGSVRTTEGTEFTEELRGCSIITEDTEFTEKFLVGNNVQHVIDLERADRTTGST